MSTKRLNNKIILAFFLLCAVYGKHLMAQSPIADIPIVKQSQISKEGNLVSFDMELNLHLIEIGKNEMVIITPLLQSNKDSVINESFPPLVVNGPVRDKVMKRQETLTSQNDIDDLKPVGIIRKDRRTPQTYMYHANLPYKSWMKDASLVLITENRGCADCDLGSESKILLARVFQEIIIPPFQLTYIEPAPEPVKARSERHTASLSFQLDRYNLLRDYQNNAVEMDKVEKIIKEIQSNEDLTITELSIEGFASPEGGFEYNRNLSGNRANSFADFLVTRYQVNRGQMKKISGMGEDWNGLRKIVESSSLAYKNEIIQIIDSVFPPDARDVRLRKISGGEVYQQLLKEFYPQLRRTDYIIGYNVRDFSVDEAKIMIKNNPELLSLNEMYLVAATYPKESKEFKEVFDIAARLYSDDPIAAINSAATEFEIGNFSEALKLLEKVKVDSRAWNNLGVVHAKMGDLKTAKDCFERAITRGDTLAKINESILEQIEANQE